MYEDEHLDAAYEGANGEEIELDDEPESYGRCQSKTELEFHSIPCDGCGAPVGYYCLSTCPGLD